ncbi:MAG: hypothetical protein NTW74_03210 [Acidobacteria bacterium]|nr:hypothetical protein [Acidobacteriota bacterium]
MDRRAFLATGVAASQLKAADWKPIVPSAELPVGRKGKGKPKLGTQHISDDPTLKILSGLGVNNICSNLPSKTMDANWSVDGLSKLRQPKAEVVPP